MVDDVMVVSPHSFTLCVGHLGSRLVPSARVPQFPFFFFFFFALPSSNYSDRQPPSRRPPPTHTRALAWDQTVTFVKSVPNGHLYTFKVENDGGNTSSTYNLVHVYGYPCILGVYSVFVRFGGESRPLPV